MRSHPIDRQQQKGPPISAIFVVHGRSEATQFELLHLLDRTVKCEIIVLHEQANRGATLLEKFERHAREASFSIVLITGDDEGHLRGDLRQALSPRGRQNVIFELGVFIGRLGRLRVIVLMEPDVEAPSDLTGLMHITLDRAGMWRHALLRELDAAGIEVDFKRSA